MKGKFVTFEGCEGAGKSRQIALLEQHLKKTGVDYVLTREPAVRPSPKRSGASSSRGRTRR